MWRWRAVGIVCLWLLDVTVAVGARWVDGAVVTNGVWDWPALIVYHVALWLLVALLIIMPERWR